MDKFEFKIHLSEIQELIKEKEFDEAALIADSIDWRRVKSPSKLCIISDLYKLVGRIEDARNIMEMAYERQPGSRPIIFSLCELCVRQGDVGQATLYYQEFNHLFPDDPGKYKLLYRLYVAQDVGIEERISLLEEFQRNQKEEKWMYELAMLYHRAGMERKCVEQCDMICTWYGEGKYRARALALKGQHTHLNAVEQAFAEGRELSSSSPTRIYGMEAAQGKGSLGIDPNAGAQAAYEAPQQAAHAQGGYAGSAMPQGYDQPAYPQDAYAQNSFPQSGYAQEAGYEADARAVNGYPQNAYPQTGFDQSAYAQSVYDGGAYGQGYDGSAYAQTPYAQPAYAQTAYDQGAYVQAGYDQNAWPAEAYNGGAYGSAYAPQEAAYPAAQAPVDPQTPPLIPDFMDGSTMDISVKTIDGDPYSTMNLQSSMEAELARNLQEVLSTTVGEVLDKFNSGDIPPLGTRVPMVKDISGFGQDRITSGRKQEAVRSVSPATLSRAEAAGEEAASAPLMSVPATPGLSRAIAGGQKRPRSGQELDSLIAEGGDGQLQLVMPDKAKAEKQITGQMRIGDVMQDWERKRLEDQAAYRRSIEDKLRFETGEILAKFAEEPDVRPAPVELSELQAVQEAFNLADQRKKKEEEEMIRVVPEPLKTVPADQSPAVPASSAPAAPVPTAPASSVAAAPVPSAAASSVPTASAPVPSASASPAPFVPEASVPAVSAASAPEASVPAVSAASVPEAPVPAASAASVAASPAPASPAPQPERPLYTSGDTNTQVIPPEELARLEGMARNIAAVKDAAPADAPEEAEPAAQQERKEAPVRSAESAAEAGLSGGTTTKELEAIAAEFIREDEEENGAYPPGQETGELTEVPEEDAEDAEEPEEKPRPRAREKRPAGTGGENGQPRSLTPEEKSLFGTFIQDQKSRNQMVDALEKISMASYTGNVILTGDIEKDNDTLAKNIMRYLSRADGNFSGRMAKVSGEAFNEKDPLKVVEKLSAGELYITGASKMTPETVAKLHKALNRAECALVVVLGDRRKAMEKFLENNPLILETFNARIDLQNLSDKELAKFAKVYAREREYSIDAMGMLALLTKIEDNQRNDHAVSVGEVREMVDEAIHHANGISPVHFIDIVTQRRYDDEDRIILKERDFARI